MEERVVSHSPAQTRTLARAVAARLAPRAVLALHGELGSGKTCFVQGLARALGVDRAVTSPTFTLIHEYRGSRPLVHIDLYRIRNEDEALELGFEDYVERDALVVIEWAERAAGLLPAGTLHLFFEVGAAAHERLITARHALPQPLFGDFPTDR
jgi:tRNA threonylcarbamoyladenosine biosynthesis protein TsaE